VRVVLSNQAEIDLEEIGDYIASDNPQFWIPNARPNPITERREAIPRCLDRLYQVDTRRVP